MTLAHQSCDRIVCDDLQVDIGIAETWVDTGEARSFCVGQQRRVEIHFIADPYCRSTEEFRGRRVKDALQR